MIIVKNLMNTVTREDIISHLSAMPSQFISGKHYSCLEISGSMCSITFNNTEASIQFFLESNQHFCTQQGALNVFFESSTEAKLSLFQTKVNIPDSAETRSENYKHSVEQTLPIVISVDGSIEAINETVFVVNIAAISLSLCDDVISFRSEESAETKNKYRDVFVKKLIALIKKFSTDSVKMSPFLLFANLKFAKMFWNWCLESPSTTELLELVPRFGSLDTLRPDIINIKMTNLCFKNRIISEQFCKKCKSIGNYLQDFIKYHSQTTENLMTKNDRLWVENIEDVIPVFIDIEFIQEERNSYITKLQVFEEKGSFNGTETWHVKPPILSNEELETKCGYSKKPDGSWTKITDTKIYPVLDEKQALINWLQRVQSIDKEIVLVTRSSFVYIPLIMNSMSRNNLLGNYISIVSGVADVISIMPGHLQEFVSQLHVCNRINLAPTLESLGGDTSLPDGAMKLWSCVKAITDDKLKRQLIAGAAPVEKTFKRQRGPIQINAVESIVLESKECSVFIPLCVTRDQFQGCVFVPSTNLADMKVIYHDAKFENKCLVLKLSFNQKSGLTILSSTCLGFILCYPAIHHWPNNLSWMDGLHFNSLSTISGLSLTPMSIRGSSLYQLAAQVERPITEINSCKITENLSTWIISLKTVTGDSEEVFLEELHIVDVIKRTAVFSSDLWDNSKGIKNQWLIKGFVELTKKMEPVFLISYKVCEIFRVLKKIAYGQSYQMHLKLTKGVRYLSDIEWLIDSCSKNLHLSQLAKSEGICKSFARNAVEVNELIASALSQQFKNESDLIKKLKVRSISSLSDHLEKLISSRPIFVDTQQSIVDTQQSTCSVPSSPNEKLELIFLYATFCKEVENPSQYLLSLHIYAPNLKGKMFQIDTIEAPSQASKEALNSCYHKCVYKSGHLAWVSSETSNFDIKTEEDTIIEVNKYFQELQSDFPDCQLVFITAAPSHIHYISSISMRYGTNIVQKYCSMYADLCTLVQSSKCTHLPWKATSDVNTRLLTLYEKVFGVDPQEKFLPKAMVEIFFEVSKGDLAHLPYGILSPLNVNLNSLLIVHINIFKILHEKEVFIAGIGIFTKHNDARLMMPIAPTRNLAKVWSRQKVFRQRGEQWIYIEKEKDVSTKCCSEKHAIETILGTLKNAAKREGKDGIALVFTDGKSWPIFLSSLIKNDVPTGLISCIKGVGDMNLALREAGKKARHDRAHSPINQAIKETFGSSYEDIAPQCSTIAKTSSKIYHSLNITPLQIHRIFSPVWSPYTNNLLYFSNIPGFKEDMGTVRVSETIHITQDTEYIPCIIRDLLIGFGNVEVTLMPDSTCPLQIYEETVEISDDTVLDVAISKPDDMTLQKGTKVGNVKLLKTKVLAKSNFSSTTVTKRAPRDPRLKKNQDNTQDSLAFQPQRDMVQLSCNNEVNAAKLVEITNSDQQHPPMLKVVNPEGNVDDAGDATDKESYLQNEKLLDKEVPSGNVILGTLQQACTRNISPEELTREYSVLFEKYPGFNLFLKSCEDLFQKNFMIEACVAEELLISLQAVGVQEYECLADHVFKDPEQTAQHLSTAFLGLNILPHEKFKMLIQILLNAKASTIQSSPQARHQGEEVIESPKGLHEYPIPASEASPNRSTNSQPAKITGQMSTKEQASEKVTAVDKESEMCMIVEEPAKTAALSISLESNIESKSEGSSTLDGVMPANNLKCALNVSEISSNSIDPDVNTSNLENIGKEPIQHQLPDLAEAQSDMETVAENENGKTCWNKEETLQIAPTSSQQENFNDSKTKQDTSCLISDTPGIKEKSGLNTTEMSGDMMSPVVISSTMDISKEPVNNQTSNLSKNASTTEQPNEKEAAKDKDKEMCKAMEEPAKTMSPIHQEDSIKESKAQTSSTLDSSTPVIDINSDVDVLEVNNDKNPNITDKTSLEDSQVVDLTDTHLKNAVEAVSSPPVVVLESVDQADSLKKHQPIKDKVPSKKVPQEGTEDTHFAVLKSKCPHDKEKVCFYHHVKRNCTLVKCSNYHKLPTDLRFCPKFLASEEDDSCKNDCQHEVYFPHINFVLLQAKLQTYIRNHCPKCTPNRKSTPSKDALSQPDLKVKVADGVKEVQVIETELADKHPSQRCKHFKKQLCKFFFTSQCRNIKAKYCNGMHLFPSFKVDFCFMYLRNQPHHSGCRIKHIAFPDLQERYRSSIPDLMKNCLTCRNIIKIKQHKFDTQPNRSSLGPRDPTCKSGVHDRLGSEEHRLEERSDLRHRDRSSLKRSRSRSPEHNTLGSKEHRLDDGSDFTRDKEASTRSRSNSPVRRGNHSQDDEKNKISKFGERDENPPKKKRSKSPVHNRLGQTSNFRSVPCRYGRNCNRGNRCWFLHF